MDHELKVTTLKCKPHEMISQVLLELFLLYDHMVKICGIASMTVSLVTKPI